MPTRIVTLTQQDVTRLDGLTYIALHRQPVLLPTRLADLVGQLGESSSARRRPLGSGRAGSPWLFPGAYPGAHQGAGYLGTSLNEQLGLEIRRGRGAALCDLADELPATVLASLLGISVDTAGRWAALVKRDWAGYIAERDGQPLGPEQTYQIRPVGHPCAVRWSARITPAGCSDYRPLTGHLRGRVLWESPSQVPWSSPTRANSPLKVPSSDGVTTPAQVGGGQVFHPHARLRRWWLPSAVTASPAPPPGRALR